MIESLIDHLWQSTLCVFAAALLTLALRKNGAKVRFFIWFAASVKFLVPLSLFVWIGEYFRWETAPGLLTDSGFSSLMGQIAQPAAFVMKDFEATSPGSAGLQSGWTAWTIMLSIWLIGSVAMLCFRLFQWLWLRAILKASSPLHLDVPIPVRETTSTLEPGVFGIFSPTLLMPAGITGRLAPAHLDAILAHELCHWQRRDNLTAAIHMLVEVLFWFHPFVWWLGGRLVVERERACDEAVIQSGSDRQIYAEGILKVCQHYVEPPMCVAGVSGGLLRKRMEEIMTNPTVSSLPFAKRCLLSLTALLAIAAPIALGLAGGTRDATAATTTAVEMKHFRSIDWKFELDIPKRWVEMPPVPSNSPNEVMRFASQEDGTHLLIVFRGPADPKQNLESVRDAVQKILAGAGFSNFVSGETSIASKRVLTLDFDISAPGGNTWSCRHYFIVDGTLAYTLGFGTSTRDAMADTYDRMAKSFVFEGA